MANVEKEAVEAMPSEAERSVNDALIEVTKRIDRAIDRFGSTPNQELEWLLSRYYAMLRGM